MGCVHKQPSTKRSTDSRQICALTGTDQSNLLKAVTESAALFPTIYDKFIRNFAPLQAAGLKPELKARA